MARRCIRNAKRGPVAIKVQGGYIKATGWDTEEER